MNATTDANDAALLGVLQETVPFTERPFADLGKRCGLSEDETLARVKALKEGKVIRQISAIFDTRSLGYASSLVAAKIAPEKLDAAVAVINSHPGVSHNYLRNHEFNLWYTIAVPPTSKLGLEGTVDALHTLSGAESHPPAAHPAAFQDRRAFRCRGRCKTGRSIRARLHRGKPPGSRAADRKGNRIRARHAA